MFEHAFASHLHFGEETHHDELLNPVVRISALVGMLVHTFFDGVAIGAGFIVSPEVGLLIFLAVFLHKIPDGFTISSLFVSFRTLEPRALPRPLLGVSTLLGVLVVHVAGDGVNYALPISTGSTLYVAATDLMPEVNRETGVKWRWWFFGDGSVLTGADAGERLTSIADFGFDFGSKSEIRNPQFEISIPTPRRLRS